MTRSPLFVLLFACAVAAACSDETTGKRVVLQTAAVTDLPADRTFVSNLGWTITLTSGQIATGAFYYFQGPPAVIEMADAGRGRRGWVGKALDWLSPIGTAHAHPGHYVPGRAMGQMLEPAALDLTAAGPTALPDGEGITGIYRSGTFSFANPASGPVATVAGIAVKGDRTVNFRVSADLADVLANAKDAQIVGSTFAETNVTGDGKVTATVHPAIWFTLVDFTGLPVLTPEPTELAPGTVPHIAFALGLAQIAAYSFELTAGEAP